MRERKKERKMERERKERERKKERMKERKKERKKEKEKEEMDMKTNRNVGLKPNNFIIRRSVQRKIWNFSH